MSNPPRPGLVPWAEMDEHALPILVGQNGKRLQCAPEWALGPLIKRCFPAPPKRPTFVEVARIVTELFDEQSSRDLGHEEPLRPEVFCPLTLDVMTDPVMCAAGLPQTPPSKDSQSRTYDHERE